MQCKDGIIKTHVNNHFASFKKTWVSQLLRDCLLPLVMTENLFWITVAGF